jgi:hypothetical protein
MLGALRLVLLHVLREQLKCGFSGAAVLARGKCTLTLGTYLREQTTPNKSRLETHSFA